MDTREEWKEALLDAARAEVGVREQGGANRGPRVEAYLASVGLNSGNPWCAAFVAWCVQQAATRTGLASDWPRTGYCPSIANWAKRTNRIEENAMPGQVFLLEMKVVGKVRFAHAGIVEGVSGTTLSTIEGNTSEEGGREGVGVFKRTRVLGTDLLLVSTEPPRAR